MMTILMETQTFWTSITNFRSSTIMDRRIKHFLPNQYVVPMLSWHHHLIQLILLVPGHDFDRWKQSSDSCFPFFFLFTLPHTSHTHTHEIKFLRATRLNKNHFLRLYKSHKSKIQTQNKQKHALGAWLIVLSFSPVRWWFEKVSAKMGLTFLCNIYFSLLFFSVFFARIWVVFQCFQICQSFFFYVRVEKKQIET